MCRRRTGKGVRNKQRGAALVEFAIVASLLFVLLLGIIDYGLLLKDYLALSQVAREATRAAAVGATPTRVEEVIDDWGAKLGLRISEDQAIIAQLKYVDEDGEKTLGASGGLNDAPVDSKIHVT